MDKKYYIHSRGGALGDSGLTTVDDVAATVAALVATPRPRHLILHFHGGLVSQEAGFGIAEKLLPLYEPAGYPIFFIWESGAWETIRNNITELADEPVFRQLLRKVLEYALQRLCATHGSRSILPGGVDPELVKKTLENFISNPSADTIPYRDFVPVLPKRFARSAADTVDVSEIQADLESDVDFQRALATLPDLPAGRRSAFAAGAVLPSHPATPFSIAASEKLSERPGQRGFVALWKAAVLIKEILVGLLHRYHAGRDHGLYATVVEEIVRAFKVGGSAVNEWAKALEWNRMKRDCDDAFQPDSSRYAGTALLERLKTSLDGGKLLDRITLVGHSTGAVYISAFIEAAHRSLADGVLFDIVLLAPAITYARFATTLTRFGCRIANLRIFAMCDALERQDQVWGSDAQLSRVRDWRRFIYPSSLLYLVSGILESKQAADGTLIDEPDMPLLGMQRFFSDLDTYDSATFPEVDAVRVWLQQDKRRTVWSKTEGGGPGLESDCIDHGDFDDEQVTLRSLAYIVRSGF